MSCHWWPVSANIGLYDLFVHNKYYPCICSAFTCNLGCGCVKTKIPSQTNTDINECCGHGKLQKEGLGYLCLRVLEEGFKVLNHEHEVLRMHLKLESSLTKVTKLYMLQSHNGHVSLNIKNLTNIDRGQSWSKLWKKLCIFCYIYKLNRLPAKIAFKTSQFLKKFC